MKAPVRAIERAFAACRREKRAAFIPFLMAGDPNLEATGDLIEALARGGADVIELGLPFSDPIADGPVNQRAASRALAAGTTLSGVLETIAARRRRVEVPIVLFTYFNPIHARGLERFAEQAAGSGVDGVLCVDLPPEEGERELVPILDAQGIDSIYLLAPTSTKERIRRAADASSGFLYYVSRTGVTGERNELAGELGDEIRRMKKKLSLPLAVGFGISTPEQAASVAAISDAVIVGSALSKLVEDAASDDAAVEAVRDLSARLKQATRRGGAS